MSKRYLGNLVTLGAPGGFSFQFPGVANAYLTTPYSTSAELGDNNFTAEAWVFPTNNGTLVGILSSYGVSNGQFTLRRTTTNRLEVAYDIGGGTVTLTGTVGFIRANQWNHVALIRKSTGFLYLMVNGVQSASVSIGSAAFNSTNQFPWNIGVAQNAGSPFLGFISNVRLCISPGAQAGDIYNVAGFNPPLELRPLSFPGGGTPFLVCNQSTLYNDSPGYQDVINFGIASAATSPNFPLPSTFSPAEGTQLLTQPIGFPPVAQITSNPFPYSGACGTGSSLGMVTLQDLAMSASQANLPNRDPFRNSNLAYATCLIRAENSVTVTNNSTFIDSSPINATVTRNGNPNQAALSPYTIFPTPAYSTYMNGGGYLNATVTAPGTGNFTYEMFLRLDSLHNNPVTVMNTRSGDTTDGFDCYISNTGVITLGYSGVDWFVSTSAGWIVPNRWYHFAIVAVGTAFSVYVNGVLVAPSPFTQATRTFTSTTLNIGRRILGSNFTGYISNFRYCTTAVYTAAFTPPSAPLGVVTSSTVTRLLTCQNDRWIDNSGNNVTITSSAAASATVSTALTRPVAINNTYLLPPPERSTSGGSTFFDGTGDYLSFATSTNYAPGTGDLSWECWIYPKSIGAARCVIGPSSSRWDISITAANVVTTFDGTTTFSIGTIQPRCWFHIAVTVVSGRVRTFFNGVLTQTATTTYTSTTTQSINIGATGTATTPFIGNITGVRFVKGGIPTAYSTASVTTGTTIFTPARTALTGDEPLTGGTVNMLLKMDNAALVDKVNGTEMEFFGTATLSSAVARWPNTKSMAFDGTSTCIITGYAEAWSMGNADCTCDFWFYPTTLAVLQWVFDFYNTSTTGRFTFRLETSGNVAFGGSGGSSIVTSSINQPPLNQWSHICFMRQGGYAGLYINGALSSPLTATAVNFSVQPNGTFAIGGQYNSVTAPTGGTFNGYIQDIRMTAGARFTGGTNLGEGFIPPTGPAQTH